MANENQIQMRQTFQISLHLQIFSVLPVQPRLLLVGHDVRRPHGQVVEDFGFHTCAGWESAERSVHITQRLNACIDWYITFFRSWHVQTRDGSGMPPSLQIHSKICFARFTCWGWKPSTIIFEMLISQDHNIKYHQVPDNSLERLRRQVVESQDWRGIVIKQSSHQRLDYDNSILQVRQTYTAHQKAITCLAFRDIHHLTDSQVVKDWKHCDWESSQEAFTLGTGSTGR